MPFVAEVKLSAKDKAAGYLKGINVPIDNGSNGKLTVDPYYDGARIKTKINVPSKTDIDIVSNDTLWQVKVGKDSVKLKAIQTWLIQGALAIKNGKAPEGAKQLGIRIDADAAKDVGYDIVNNSFTEHDRLEKIIKRIQTEYQITVKIVFEKFP